MGASIPFDFRGSCEAARSLLDVVGRSGGCLVVALTPSRSAGVAHCARLAMLEADEHFTNSCYVVWDLRIFN